MQKDGLAMWIYIYIYLLCERILLWEWVFAMWNNFSCERDFIMQNVFIPCDRGFPMRKSFCNAIIFIMQKGLQCERFLKKVIYYTKWILLCEIVYHAKSFCYAK